MSVVARAPHLVAVALLGAGAAACSAPPAPRDVAAPREAPVHADASDVHDVYAIPSRGARPLDRIARLDASLATAATAEIPGTEAYGALAAGGAAFVVLVPRARQGAGRPELLRFDATTLEPRALGPVAPELVPGAWKTRPDAPFFVGDAVPRLVVVPLSVVRPRGDVVFDVTLRVVDVTAGTTSDVAAPPDALRGTLVAAADGSPRAVVTTRLHEIHEVDLTSGRTRRVTRGPFLPSHVAGTTPTAVCGVAVRAEDGDVLAVNHDGEAVRIALSDGDVRPVALPIDGLGATAFVEGLAWSAASRRFAVTVLRKGDEGNWPGHVVLLDGDLRATGVEIAAPPGVMQTLFSPHGTELVVRLFDGSLRRHRVADGALLAVTGPGFAAEALLGVR